MSHLSETAALTLINFSALNEHWKREANSFGNNFDFECQLFYKENFEGLTLPMNFDVVYQPEERSEAEIVCLEELTEVLKETIEIYEKNRKLFNSYDRKKITLKQLMKDRFFVSESTIEAAEFKLEIMKCERERYFSSELFKNVGFAEIDYHEKHYYYALQLLREIDDNLKFYTPYNKNYLNINNVEIVPRNITEKLWTLINGVQINYVTAEEFHNELNFFHVTPLIKIKKGELNAMYYLINQVYAYTRYNKVWLKNFLQEHNLETDAFNKKRKEKERSDFAEKVDGILKIKEKEEV